MKDKYIYIVESMKSATFDTSKLQALGLENKASYIDVINAIATDSEGKVSTAVTAAGTMMNSVSDGTVANDKVIDVLDKISASDWNQILDVFKFADQGTTDQVVKYVDNFNHMNTFLFGLNIADAPGMKLTVALIVPILSAVLQFISSKISMSASKNNSNDPAAAQTNSMMNMMTYGMPLMSLFICINLPIAIGLYWIIGSVISIITQLIINNYYKKCDVDKVLEKCKEKAARKQARKRSKTSWQKIIL